MLADRGYRHVSYEDHLAVSFLKPYVQVSLRIFADPGEVKLVGPGHPCGRFPQSFPVGVLPLASSISLTVRSIRTPSIACSGDKSPPNPRNLLASAPREG